MRSTERAQELGEVFTNEREVIAMLDLVPDMFKALDYSFLEPACGHGNFLVEILARKLQIISLPSFQIDGGELEYSLLRAVASIYAVDISEENVSEARHRLFEMIQAAHAFAGGKPSKVFDRSVKHLLETNILLGDSINAASEILFTEYIPIDGYRFERRHFFLEEPEMDLFYEPPRPLKTVHYLKLGLEG